MFKKIVFAFGVYLLSVELKSQSNLTTSILKEIEQNNKELQAYSSLQESRHRQFKSGNNLPDPQASAYYLPWGDHGNRHYSEFELTQTFEFPTVYSTRNNLIEKMQVQADMEYALKRQDILLDASITISELIYFNKKLKIEEIRLESAKKVFEQVQKLFEEEQVGVLEVNKAKIVWIQEEYKVEQIESDKKNLLIILQNLNGGKSVDVNEADFIENLDLSPLDTIWKDMQALDPSIKLLKQEEEIASQRLKLSKSNSLPNLTAGFNYQGISGLTYSGVYGGISIPLWNNKNKVKAARTNFQYQQTYSDSKTLTAYAEFQKQYNNYLVILKKFQEYQKSLKGLNSEALLLKSYELGQLSFMEYYLELQFYHQAFDSMLEMEIQLNMEKAQILKHQL